MKCDGCPDREPSHFFVIKFSGKVAKAFICSECWKKTQIICDFMQIGVSVISEVSQQEWNETVENHLLT